MTIELLTTERPQRRRARVLGLLAAGLGAGILWAVASSIAGGSAAQADQHRGLLGELTGTVVGIVSGVNSAVAGDVGGAVATVIEPVAPVVAPVVERIPDAAAPLEHLADRIVTPPVPVVAEAVNENAVTPIVALAEPVLTPVLDPAVESLTPVTDSLQPALSPLAPVLNALDPVLDSLAPVLAPLTPVIAPLTPVLDPLTPVLEPLNPVLTPLIPLVPVLDPGAPPATDIGTAPHPLDDPVLGSDAWASSHTAPSHTAPSNTSPSHPHNHAPLRGIGGQPTDTLASAAAVPNGPPPAAPAAPGAALSAAGSTASSAGGRDGSPVAMDAADQWNSALAAGLRAAPSSDDSTTAPVFETDTFPD